MESRKVQHFLKNYCKPASRGDIICYNCGIFQQRSWEHVDISIVINQMIVLVLIMLVGYIARKAGITSDEANRHMSKLLINVFLVCSIIRSTVNVDPVLTGREMILLFLLFAAGFGIYWLVGWLYVTIFHIRKDRGITILLMVFINTVFLGFPIIESIYGTEAIFAASLSTILFNLLLYTAGIAQLTSDEKGRFSLKTLVNAPVFAVLVSIVLFLTRIHVPKPIENTLSTIASGTVPLSMLIIGTSLGGINVRDIFSDWRPYVISALRLLLCPLLCALVFRNFTDNPMMLGILIILSACPPAVMLTPVCIDYGQDATLASKTICISTVLSTITIPLVLWITL